MNTTSSAMSQSAGILSRDASMPKLTRQGESTKQFMITTELEWSKHTELTTPKQRTNFDSKVANMVHSKSRTMSPMERGMGRPYTSPKKTYVQVNVISETPLDQTSRFYDEVDLQVHKKFAEAKHITEKSTTHINNLFKSMEMVTEIQKVKVSIDKTFLRPTSAYSPGESFSRAAKNLQRDIDFIKSHGNRSLHLPPWNDQFIHGNTITPRLLAPVAPIHQVHSDFVKNMSKYKVLAPPGSSLLDDYPCRSPEQSKALLQSTLTVDSSYNSSVLLAKSASTSSFQHEPDAMARTMPQSHDVPSDQYDTASSDDNGARRAHEVWHNLVNNLHTFGNDIIYNDLFEFSILREPPAIVSKYLGYMAVLMGLKPDWSTVRSTLLKENKIFLNFVVEVNPTEIPIRRVRKAYATDLSDLQFALEQGQRVCAPLPKLAQWIACFQTIAHALIAIDDVRGKENQDSKLKKTKKRKKKSLAEKLLDEEEAKSGADHPKTKTFIRRLSKNKKVLESLGAGERGEGKARDQESEEDGDAAEMERALIERGLMSRPGSPGEYTDVFAQIDEQDHQKSSSHEAEEFSAEKRAKSSPTNRADDSKPRVKTAEKKKPPSGDSRPGSRQKSRGSAGKEETKGSKGETKGNKSSNPPITTQGVGADLAALFADLDESDARDHNAKPDKKDKTRNSSDSRDRGSFTSLSKASKSASLDSRDDSLSKKGSASKSFYLEAPPQKEHLALTSGKPFTKKASGKTSKPSSAKQKDKSGSGNDISVDTSKPVVSTDPDLISPHTSPLGSDITTGTTIAQIHDTEDPFLLSTDKIMLGVSSSSSKAHDAVGIAMLPLDKAAVDKGHDADDEGGYEEYGADDDFVDDDNDQQSVFKHLQESTSSQAAAPAPTPVVEAAPVKPLLTPKYPVHQRVVSNYLGKGIWYSATIVKVRATSSSVSYDIDYDGGMKEKHVTEELVLSSDGKDVVALEKILGSKVVFHDSKRPISAAEVVYNVQQKVMVKYKDTGRWYAGKVVKKRAGERYDVLFEDGEMLQAVDATSIRPCVDSSALPASPAVNPAANAKHKIGTKVEANRLGQGTWLSASISRVRDSKVYDVKYESDGFEEKRVGEDEIRLPSPKAPSNLPFSALFEVDARVEVNFRALQVWYDAVVLKVRQSALNTLYDVQLDDGRKEFRVDEGRIRPRELTVTAGVSVVEESSYIEGSVIDLNNSQDTTDTARLAKQNNQDIRVPAERISRKYEEYDDETFESTLDNDSVAKQDKLLEELQQSKSNPESSVVSNQKAGKDDQDADGQDEFYDDGFEETSNNDFASPVASTPLVHDVAPTSVSAEPKEESVEPSTPKPSTPPRAVSPVATDENEDIVLDTQQEVKDSVVEEPKDSALTPPEPVEVAPAVAEVEVQSNPKDPADETNEYADDDFEEDAGKADLDAAAVSCNVLAVSADAVSSSPQDISEPTLQPVVVDEQAESYADDTFDVAQESGEGPSDQEVVVSAKEALAPVVAEKEKEEEVAAVVEVISSSAADEEVSSIAPAEELKVGENDTSALVDTTCEPESEHQAVALDEPTQSRSTRDSHEHVQVKINADAGGAASEKEELVGENDTIAVGDSACVPESEHLAIAASELTQSKGRRDHGDHAQSTPPASDAALQSIISALPDAVVDTRDDEVASKKLLASHTTVGGVDVAPEDNKHLPPLKGEEDNGGDSAPTLPATPKPVSDEADAYADDEFDVVPEKSNSSTNLETPVPSEEANTHAEASSPQPAKNENEGKSSTLPPTAASDNVEQSKPTPIAGDILVSKDESDVVSKTKDYAADDSVKQDVVEEAKAENPASEASANAEPPSSVSVKSVPVIPEATPQLVVEDENAYVEDECDVVPEKSHSSTKLETTVLSEEANTHAEASSHSAKDENEVKSSKLPPTAASDTVEQSTPTPIAGDTLVSNDESDVVNAADVSMKQDVVEEAKAENPASEAIANAELPSDVSVKSAPVIPEATPPLVMEDDNAYADDEFDVIPEKSDSSTKLETPVPSEEAKTHAEASSIQSAKDENEGKSSKLLPTVTSDNVAADDSVKQDVVEEAKVENSAPEAIANAELPSDVSVKSAPVIPEATPQLVVEGENAYADDEFDVVAEKKEEYVKLEMPATEALAAHVTPNAESSSDAQTAQASEDIVPSSAAPAVQSHDTAESAKKPQPAQEVADEYADDEFDVVTNAVSVKQDVVVDAKLLGDSKESSEAAEKAVSNGEEVGSDAPADVSVAKPQDGEDDTKHAGKDADSNPPLPSSSLSFSASAKVAIPSIANEVAAEEGDSVAIAGSVGVKELPAAKALVNADTPAHAHTLTVAESAAAKKEAATHEAMDIKREEEGDEDLYALDAEIHADESDKVKNKTDSNGGGVRNSIKKHDTGLSDDLDAVLGL